MHPLKPLAPNPIRLTPERPIDARAVEIAKQAVLNNTLERLDPLEEYLMTHSIRPHTEPLWRDGTTAVPSGPLFMKSVAVVGDAVYVCDNTSSLLPVATPSDPEWYLAGRLS
jgi:hypothetical protein